MAVITPIDGISVDQLGSNAPNPGLSPGRSWNVFGQTHNQSGSSVANQAEGTVSLPAIAAGASGTVTIANSLITGNSLVLLTVVNMPAAGGAGDATANRGVSAWIDSIAAGTMTIGYRNDGQNIMSQAWSCNYRITN